MRRLLPLLTVLAMLTLPLAGVADAAPVLEYDGSFKLPRTSTFYTTDHYARRLAFVPDGNTRPGNANAVTGPSLVVWYSWGGRVAEFNAFPTLATDSGDLAFAAGVTNASGGTMYQGQSAAAGKSPEFVDSAGNLWDAQASSGASQGLYSDPGNHALGQSVLPGGYGVQESGWLGQSYPSSGALRRGDGLGGDLPTDGTAVGATFLTSSHESGSSDAVIHQQVRVDATTMGGAGSGELFRLTGMADFADGQRVIDYVRAPDGSEYFMMLKFSGGRSGDDFFLDFYDSDASGSDPTAAASINIGAMIADGVGWMSSGNISDVAVDWDNSTLYALEYSGQDARVHVFSFAPVPEPTTLALLTAGGLALAIRRRRR